MRGKQLSVQITSQKAGKTGLIQTFFRILLGLTLLYTGTAHLTWARVDFLAQVPKWLPLDGDLVVVLSGIVELILGVSLIFLHPYRAVVGWVTAAFFVIIFTGNISQFIDRVDGFGMNTDTARGIRLLFQPVLIAWALWSTGAWQAWWNSRKTRKS